jgi:SAM-dependent methyltransferase
MPVASRLSGRDERVALLGALAPLFDDRFVRSCDLYEAYVEGLACEAFAATGLAAACATPRTLPEAIDAAGLDAAVALVPAAWLCAMLAARGALDSAGGRHHLRAAPPPADLAALRAAQAGHDPGCLPAYELAAYAARHYPAVLSGAVSGEQVLAAPEALDLWTGYFSNANALYAVSNAVGAIAAGHALARLPGAVLELGAGLGSAAEALLERVPRAAITSYRLTDASPLFLRRAQRALRPRCAGLDLQAALLDIDRPFADAGIAPRSVALVYAVNVLHVARDLGAALAEVREALAPGGALVIAECLRPLEGRPLHAELPFNLLGAFRAPVLDPQWRPNGGFLTPSQWRAALEAHGFRDVAVLPDLDAIRDAYPSFVVGAITARPA